MSVRNPEHAAFGASDIASGESDAMTLIDRETFFEGTFSSKRDMRIEGQAKGSIECRGTLFIAQGADVSARIETDHLTVAGELNGDVICRGKLLIMPTGRVRGKISTASLIVNEGAVYEGQLEMIQAEAKSPTSPRPIQPVGGGRTAAEGGASNTFIRRLGGSESPWQNSGDQSSSGDEGEES